MCGNDARFMGNAQLFERFGGVLERLPVRGGAHDDSDQRFASQSRVLAILTGWRQPESDILRRFSAGGDLRALLPVVAKLSHKIQRAGDKHGVFGTGLG